MKPFMIFIKIGDIIYDFVLERYLAGAMRN